MTETVDRVAVFPGSSKVYVSGDGVRVPMREIELAPTPSQYGAEENLPLRVYDTSGPYTDPDVEVDVRRGLAPLRRPWVLSRADVEEYEGSPVHGRANASQPDLIRRPL